MTKQEFAALVKRHQAGDADAIRELRRFADDPRMRREAVKRATSRKTQPRRSMSSKPKAAGPQLRVPPRGRIVRSAVQEVIDLLGIERPVAIRWGHPDEMTPAAPGYRTNGDHVQERNLSHTILLLPGRSAEATTKTLLHELHHAAQSERHGHRWRTAYDANPASFEADADELARVLGHLKLVR